MNIHPDYEVVVGLEVHAQLKTNTKAYVSDSTEYGATPNTLISVITLGHPGTLPKVNEKTVDYAMKMGLATHCQITRHNVFARKNYFYPDLPKGYQITQDKNPICQAGYLDVKCKDGNTKRIGITRIHMEEDAGKSMHLAEETDTLVDFNRAGVPLIEIVSEPDIRSTEEAYLYLQEIRRLVIYLDVCDGNMEEGSMRCDANISVRKKGETIYNTRVEVKNMNSFRNVQRAIEYEAQRQIEIMEKGLKHTIIQETRNFDANTGITTSMRTKENLNDYRYFPEPDLTPVIISDEWLTRIKNEMPALPQELFEKFTKQYKLSEYDALVLIENKEIALYFEELAQITNQYKQACNWVTVEIKGYLNELALSLDKFSLTPAHIAQIMTLVQENKVSHSVASQKLFPILAKNPNKTAEQIAKEENMLLDNDTDAITAIAKEVIAMFPEKVQEYKGGKKGILGMFMGEIMKRTKGKADPKATNQLLADLLDNM